MQVKATVRKNERIDAKVGALFKNRYLFVQKEWTARRTGADTERKLISRRKSK